MVGLSVYQICKRAGLRLKLDGVLGKRDTEYDLENRRGPRADNGGAVWLSLC